MPTETIDPRSFPETFTLNGYAIKARYRVDSLLEVVLIDRAPDFDWRHRYVTATHRIGDESWSHGHYIDKELDALDDFVKRIEIWL